jgi:hypothetical protein
MYRRQNANRTGKNPATAAGEFWSEIWGRPGRRLSIAFVIEKHL